MSGKQLKSNEGSATSPVRHQGKLPALIDAPKPTLTAAVGFLRCFEEQLDWSFDDIPEGAHMYRAEILKLYNATITTTA